MRYLYVILTCFGDFKLNKKACPKTLFANTKGELEIYLSKSKNCWRVGDRKRKTSGIS